MQNILLLEDHSETRMWLSEMLHAAFKDIKTHEAASLAQAKQLLSENNYELAMIDLNLPDGTGVDFINTLKKQSPETYVVVATVFDDDEHLFPALEAGADYIVAKNRLFKLALQEAGVEDSFDDVLEGTTAFAFGKEDVVAPAKVVYDLAKSKGEVFNIKAGLLSGKRVDATEVEALAKLPSREQLLSMVLNGMLGPIRKLAYATVAIADKKEEAGE